MAPVFRVARIAGVVLQMTSGPAEHKPIGHLVQLDGVRGIGMFLVFVQHWVPQGHILLKPFVWGMIGVHLFFVLSGFLITQILLRCRGNIETGRSSFGFSLRRFYARRFLRIFPMFYLSLIVLAFFNIGIVRETFWWHVTYLSNVYLAIMGSMQGTITHFWTLSVEEQFYLAWPLLIFLTPRKWLVPVLVAIVFSAPAYRVVTTYFRCNPIVRVWLPFANLDALGLGALLAIFYADRAKYDVWRRRLGTIGWCVGGGGMLLIMVLRSMDLLRWSYEILGLSTFLALFCFVVIDKTASGPKGLWVKLLSHPAMVHCGKISYATYILHDFVPEALHRIFEPLGLKLPESLLLSFMLYATVSLTLASLAWIVIERPLHNLKRYLPYAPPAAALKPAEAAEGRP
jgi:peptidoglycan/LPS O-acetylase OafA/YrhL